MLLESLIASANSIVGMPVNALSRPEYTDYLIALFKSRRSSLPITHLYKQFLKVFKESSLELLVMSTKDYNLSIIKPLGFKQEYTQNLNGPFKYNVKIKLSDDRPPYLLLYRYPHPCIRYIFPYQFRRTRADYVFSYAQDYVPFWGSNYLNELIVYPALAIGNYAFVDVKEYNDELIQYGYCPSERIMKPNFKFESPDAISIVKQFYLYRHGMFEAKLDDNLDNKLLAVVALSNTNEVFISLTPQMFDALNLFWMTIDESPMDKWRREMRVGWDKIPDTYVPTVLSVAPFFMHKYVVYRAKYFGGKRIDDIKLSNLNVTKKYSWIKNIKLANKKIKFSFSNDAYLWKMKKDELVICIGKLAFPGFTYDLFIPNGTGDLYFADVCSMLHKLFQEIRKRFYPYRGSYLESNLFV